MPSEKILEQKKQAVAELSAHLKKAVLVLLLTTAALMLLMTLSFVKNCVKQATPMCCC
ncbi:MAG: hypothetical protein ACLTE2_00105 [Eubacteriales bacterium]